MDPTLAAVLGVLFRWTHIASMALLVGGMYYAYRARTPLDPGFARTLYAILAAILVSGVYNLLTKPAYPPHYHMWFGIKMLLVLHIFAVALLLAKKSSDPAKHRRWITGILGSAAFVIGISAYLRWLSLSPVVKLP